MIAFVLGLSWALRTYVFTAYEIRAGFLYSDGGAQTETYTHGKPTLPLTNSTITFPYTVPSGYIWVMGDNRTNSQDSRYFGAVPTSSVTGRGVLVYWPVSDLGLLE